MCIVCKSVIPFKSVTPFVRMTLTVSPLQIIHMCLQHLQLYLTITEVIVKRPFCFSRSLTADLSDTPNSCFHVSWAFPFLHGLQSLSCALEPCIALSSYHWGRCISQDAGQKGNVDGTQGLWTLLTQSTIPSHGRPGHAVCTEICWKRLGNSTWRNILFYKYDPLLKKCALCSIVCSARS